MKTTQFTESQIVSILKQQEQGVKVSDIAREHGQQHQQNRHRIPGPKRPDHTAEANKNSQYKFPKPVHNRSLT